jgi:excisionase family DNA binding protein
MSDDLLTADELAQVLNVRAGTIRRWAKDGIIPAIRISPKVLRFCYSDVLSALRMLAARQSAESGNGVGRYICPRCGCCNNCTPCPGCWEPNNAGGASNE